MHTRTHAHIVVYMGVGSKRCQQLLLICSLLPAGLHPPSGVPAGLHPPSGVPAGVDVSRRCAPLWRMGCICRALRWAPALCHDTESVTLGRDLVTQRGLCWTGDSGPHSRGYLRVLRGAGGPFKIRI